MMHASRGLRVAVLLILALALPTTLAQRTAPPPPGGKAGPAPVPGPTPVPTPAARPPPPNTVGAGARRPPPPGATGGTPGAVPAPGTAPVVFKSNFPPSPFAPLNNPALMCIGQDFVNPQTGGPLGVLLDPVTGQPTWNPLSASPDIAKLYIGDQPVTPMRLSPFQDKWQPLSVKQPTGTEVCRGDGHCMRAYEILISDEKLRPFDRVVPRCPLGNFIDAACALPPIPTPPPAKLPLPTCTRVDKVVYDGTWFLTYDGMVPGPQMRAPVGHEVFMRFHNRICTTQLAGIADPLAPPPPVGAPPAPLPDPACVAQAASPKGIFFTNGAPLPPDVLVIPPTLCEARTDRTGAPLPGRGRAISVHHHGSASISPFDGWAEDMTCWDDAKDYVFPINRPTTAWYHDHALHITQFNALFGLSAMFVHSAKQAEGGCGEPWNLDNIPEIPMMLGDKLLDHTCQQYKDLTTHEYMFFGDINMVNGMPFPVMDLEPKTYRFRFLNAAVSRPWILRLKAASAGYPDRGPTYCKVIAGDGGFRQTPVAFPIEGMLIGVAERYEIVCDFTQMAGQTLYWWNDRDLVSFDGGGLHHNIVPYFCWTHLIAQIRVGARTTASISAPKFDPSKPPPPEIAPTGTVMTQSEFDAAVAMANAGQYHRQFEFSNLGGIWTINGQTWDSVRIAASDVGQNTWELWKIVSGGSWFHPVHIHLIDGYIVKRVTFRGPLLRTYEQVTPKDVFFIGPTNQLYVIIRFGAHKGEYMFHCHNLVHEDLDMMRSFQVRDVAASMTDTPTQPSRAGTADRFVINPIQNIVYSTWAYFDPIDGLSCKDPQQAPGHRLCDPAALNRVPLDSVPIATAPALATALDTHLARNYYEIFYPTDADKAAYGGLNGNAAGVTNPWQAGVCGIKAPPVNPPCNHANPC